MKYKLYIMKLELKHIAPYLPYGLKIQTNCGELLMIGDNINDCLVTNRKPILRPLSDLTNEIEVNDCKFIPLISLLEIHQGEYSSKFRNEETITYISGTTHTLEYLFTNPDMNIYREKFNFNYSEYLQGFHAGGNSTEKREHIDYQLSLFQKLFEWHFDVFGLIPERLAIDINTLKK